ncbi:uncharacterized protein METZ01_LOCUS218760 [marine metagenome]|uniref:RanBP2-type domain-containing protein n=1 Tax=marine metagenome TaxID=408172 RepID=A0A382FS33_9ZZZZ
MNYKKIYSAANATAAHLIQGLLEQESIKTNRAGESLSTVWGGLQTDFNEVEILVDEEKYAEALEIISNYEEILRQPAQDGESWECEECNKVNPETFEMCWSCQAIRMTVA